MERSINSVKIVHKELANGLKAIMLTIGEQEGMLLPDLARVLGVEGQALRMHIKRRNLKIVTICDDQTRRHLQRENVIHIQTTRINFLPRETIQELVKRVGTPEAKAVYNQLWDVAEAVRTGDIQTARTIVGLDIGLPDPRDVISQLKVSLAGWEQALAEADRERALRLVESKRADAEVVAHIETKRTAKISRVQLPGMVPREASTRKARIC